MQLAIFIFLSFRDYFDLQSSERSIEVPLGGVFYVLFFASALCGVPSIIREYFVAVFQTARHIINVGARTTQRLPTISICLADYTETNENTDDIEHRLRGVSHKKTNQDTTRVTHAAYCTSGGAVVTTASSRGMGAGTLVHW